MPNAASEPCTCDTWCGDDPRVGRDRSVKPCAQRINWAHSEAIEIERLLLLTELRTCVGGVGELGVLRAALLAFQTSAASGRPVQTHQQGGALSDDSPAPP